MKKVILIAISAITLFVVSCSKKAKDLPTPSTDAMVNDWWVKLDGTGSYYNLSTYNTADNNGQQMWIDDLFNSSSFWDIQGVMTVNAAAKTFSGTNIANFYYLSTFTITNGKIITKGTKSPVTKEVRDSIYFQIKFSDDATGVTHTVAGYSDPKFAQSAI